ncbi:hypothetical protein SPFM15_00269 [Salmonella phage SPFM15]|nr:hypothetical protein SPFM5_00264 [Salmonella phage SPFM5]VFR13893.1 hypothetical protein SPFM15_00269 [Salmonella phage SPFM15]
MDIQLNWARMSAFDWKYDEDKIWQWATNEDRAVRLGNAYMRTDDHFREATSGISTYNDGMATGYENGFSRLDVFNQFANAALQPFLVAMPEYRKFKLRYSDAVEMVRQIEELGELEHCQDLISLERFRETFSTARVFKESFSLSSLAPDLVDRVKMWLQGSTVWTKQTEGSGALRMRMMKKAFRWKR